jgi:hypothetical protein
MPRNGTAAGAKNCLDVAFSSVWRIVAYSGKLYALVNLLEPWQTRLGSVSGALCRATALSAAGPPHGANRPLGAAQRREAASVGIIRGADGQRRSEP